MRRIVSLFVCAIMLLALVGCSSTPAASQIADPTPTPTPTPEPESPIQYVRQSIYDDAQDKVRTVLSDEIIQEMVDMVTKSEGDFEELYNTVLGAYDMQTKEDWTQNEILLADTVHEFCQNAYWYASQRWTYDVCGEGLTGMAKTMYNNWLNIAEETFEHVLLEADKFYAATSASDLTAIKNDIEVSVGEDQADGDLSVDTSAEPIPDNGVDSIPLEITGGELFDYYGVPSLSVYVRNKGDKIIDAYDIQVRAYNRYGELLKRYGTSESTVEYSAGGDVPALRAGSSTPEDLYWSLYGLDGVAKVEVALIKCHIADGDTMDLKQANWKWYTITMD